MASLSVSSNAQVDSAMPSGMNIKLQCTAISAERQYYANLKACQGGWLYM